MSYPQTVPNAPQVGVLHLGGQQQFVQSTPITFATGTKVIIPAAPAGYQICILSLALVITTTAVNVTIESTTGPLALTGAMAIAASSPFVLPFNQGGWFYSIPGDSITVFQSGTSQISGVVTWCLFQPTS